MTDALNQDYVFAYDALGRQLSQTRAATTMSYEYDAVGNRTKRTDYISRQTTYEYDILNRLKKINYLQSYEGNPPPTPILTAGYNYDDLSRLTSAINEAGTVSFTYDNRSRVKTSTDVFNHLVEYSYDANSNRTQLKLDGTVHTNYAYDVANRLTTLTDEASQNFTFGYDIANRLISKTLPNGINTTYNYDGMSRLSRLKHQSQTATLTDNNFTYNTANQINQIAELTQTKNFGYDTIDRLTSMNNGTANEIYAFDGVGNRTTSQRSSTYGYQPFNKLTSTQTATYAYNANGNMLSKADTTGFWIYSWDYENRMVTARKQNKIVRYQYDALGRRVLRMGKNIGSTAKYTYDGLDVILDDGSEGIVKYQNGLGIDNKLKMVTNGNAKYFLQDHLGSTVGLVDSSGNITSSASYDSFGNSTNNLSTRYQYTGREKDEFTGLHYYRARWYDANLGRFISEDPIGFAGEDMNLYGYVWNNPAMFRDPRGTQGEMVIAPALPMLPALGAIASAAAVAGGAIISSPAVVAGVGFAAGYAIGYYPGHWIARYRFPEQYGDTESCPTTKPDTAPKPIPVPVPVPVSASPAYPRQQPPDDKRRCAKDPISPFGQFSNGQGICTYRCGDGSVLILGNAQWDGRNWICKSR